MDGIDEGCAHGAVEQSDVKGMRSKQAAGIHHRERHRNASAALLQFDERGGGQGLLLPRDLPRPGVWQVMSYSEVVGQAVSCGTMDSMTNLPCRRPWLWHIRVTDSIPMRRCR